MRITLHREEKVEMMFFVNFLCVLVIFPMFILGVLGVIFRLVSLFVPTSVMALGGLLMHHGRLLHSVC